MKTMLYSDLLVLKRQLGHVLVFFPVLILFTWVILYNSPALLLFTAPIMAVMTINNLSLDDERGAWQGMRLALPLTRTQIVGGRYASLGLIAVGTTLFSLVVYLLVRAGQAAVPALGELVRMSVPFSIPELAFWAGIGLAAPLLMLGALLPFVFRLGMTKAMRFSPGVLMLLFYVLIQLFLSKTSVLKPQIVQFISDPLGPFVLAAALVCAGCALFALSAALSAKLYEKREF